MLTLETDSFKWSADASGYSLTLRTPLAKRVCDEVKPDRKYVVEIKECRKKRSLNANALYWKVLSLYAEAVRVSVPFAHNTMLARYGQREVYDEPVYVMLPDTEEAQKRAEEAESYHLAPTSHVKPGKDGRYRAWMLLRGSSTYDVSEMRRLIDGLLDECRQINLEVLTEQERSLLYDQ